MCPSRGDYCVPRHVMFFFKQKTAYEMRISDWSSDVCSSDLLCEVAAGARRFPVQAFLLGSTRPDAPAVGFFGGVHGLERIGAQVAIARSEERRVGKACVRSCRFRWSPSP